MADSATRPLIMERACQLAEQAADRNQSQPATPLPGNVLMAHRPNTLAESLRHGRSVARILAGWHVAPEVQAAGLLHSLACKNALTPDQIDEHCSTYTARLCQQYNQILQPVSSPRRRGRPQTIKRVRLYQAAYTDPALAFLGVASLWDHFEVAQNSGTPVLQRLFAAEARQVLIPLLKMLGMWQLKTDLETWLVRREISPQDGEQITKRLAQTEPARTEAFALVKKTLQSALPQARVTSKTPTPLHAYQPSRPEKFYHEALTKLTVNVCVEDEPACYQALRWVNRFWQPVESKLVDHIGASKLNGYRCLETTVIVPLGSGHVRAHVNIFTHHMEQVNLWGIAALQKPELQDCQLPDAWWSRRAEQIPHIQSAEMGSLPDILYVFTPQGQLLRFPRGCTVVDFAYRVHSEVAHQTKGFKINGEPVSPATVLHHLDLVEMEIDPQFAGPNRAWLNAARTQRARTDIERFLKRRRQGEIDGRTIISEQLRELSKHYRIDIPNHKIDQVLNAAARRYNCDSRESLLAEIAVGRVPVSSVLHPLFSNEVVRQIELPPHINLRPRQMELAQCCKPRPGDPIIGRPRTRRGVVEKLKIHQANCRDIAALQGAIPLKWRLQPNLNAVARLEIVALAKRQLLQDALPLFDSHFPRLTLHQVNAASRNGTARLNFTVEADDPKLIETVAQNLKSMPGHSVNEVQVMQLTHSEQVELARPTGPVGFNPYRRQPVQDRDMFFGRAEELYQIRELLRAGAGAVFVQGQKRVGKTSLLLYLKKHYLNRRSKVPVFIDFQLLSNLSGPDFFYQIGGAVYNDLQADNQINHQVEPPIRELFERDSARQLADYLQYVQSHFGYNKLVLLIDEFSRTIDAFRQGQLSDTIFHNWRGIIQTVAPEVSMVMVMQEQTYRNMRQQPDQSALAPVWILLELGQIIPLPPLSKKDAHQLFERPTYNHLEYSPEALRAGWRLTGGSPFLIHAFCFELVRHMAHAGRRRVELPDVQTLQQNFMRPGEPIFSHLLDIVSNIPHATPVCHTLALTERPLSEQQLAKTLPNILPQVLQETLNQLLHQHILVEAPAQQWQFASLLFARWLAINRVLE